ncbi:hypothetical protein LOD99_10461 [Oopsacas minuta]|uniref:Uncharacterized protein n=1 Tax=Oopsacas minuta TaxID=111878 RepID=A0AAV7KH77_9METZ|nr:hypothetical protein LOD99_10461 [Oopsacas minuta]
MSKVNISVDVEIWKQSKMLVCAFRKSHMYKYEYYVTRDEMLILLDLQLLLAGQNPTQQFSLEGELIEPILTEDQIVGACNFNLFYNPITDERRIYICDFWDNSISVWPVW